MKNEKELFEKYFITNNPIIRQNNNQIKVQLLNDYKMNLFSAQHGFQ